MTDGELICNLGKRFSPNVFRLVSNFPSVEQKLYEVDGFLCCRSTEKIEASLGGGVTCNTALCSCVRVALHQRLSARSVIPFKPRHKHAYTQRLLLVLYMLRYNTLATAPTDYQFIYHRTRAGSICCQIECWCLCSVYFGIFVFL